tara:strand:+ start:215 stop:394 length:180 start_codon:yes stop_codon:yes gene_type:complete
VIEMSWENQIKKYDATAEIERALGIVRKLRKHYNIKTEHTEGLESLLVEILNELQEKPQ